MPSFRGRLWFCSNFAPCPNGVTISNTADGSVITYPTAEHAYVAGKTVDIGVREIVSRIATPAQAKRYGRTIALRRGWARIRDEVMRVVLMAKFDQNPTLLDQLIATGDEMLIEENNWHDTYWGTCTCQRHGGRGHNKLGVFLMEVREHFR